MEHQSAQSSSTEQETDNAAPTELEAIPLTPEVSDALKNIDPEQRKILVHFLRETKLSAFSGPIPPPEVLQGYETVQQGFAERILKMAEKQQDHRMSCEDKIVTESTSQSKRGQIIGCIIAILFLAGSVLLGLEGHDVLAGVIGGGTLISLVTVFVTNKPNSASQADKSGTEE